MCEILQEAQRMPKKFEKIEKVNFETLIISLILGKMYLGPCLVGANVEGKTFSIIWMQEKTRRKKYVGPTKMFSFNFH
jgi:hypothetical protein